MGFVLFCFNDVNAATYCERQLLQSNSFCHLFKHTLLRGDTICIYSVALTRINLELYLNQFIYLFHIAYSCVHLNAGQA